MLGQGVCNDLTSDERSRGGSQELVVHLSECVRLKDGANGMGMSGGFSLSESGAGLGVRGV